MARRLTASISVDAPGVYHGEAAPAEHFAQVRTRIKCTGAPGSVVARSYVEHCDDHDPADPDSGSWTVLAATRTRASAFDAASEAVTRELPEAARPRGGWIRLVVEVTSAPAGSTINAELWADTRTFEDALGLPVGQRVRTQDQDDRRDLSDPAI